METTIDDSALYMRNIPDVLSRSRSNWEIQYGIKAEVDNANEGGFNEQKPLIRRRSSEPDGNIQRLRAEEVVAEIAGRQAEEKNRLLTRRQEEEREKAVEANSLKKRRLDSNEYTEDAEGLEDDEDGKNACWNCRHRGIVCKKSRIGNFTSCDWCVTHKRKCTFISTS